MNRLASKEFATHSSAQAHWLLTLARTRASKQAQGKRVKLQKKVVARIQRPCKKPWFAGEPLALQRNLKQYYFH
jgi:hypothetical protein